MPLLMGLAGHSEFTPYAYFEADTKYGEAERWMAPPAAPAVAPAPTGIPKGTTGLLTTNPSRGLVAPVVAKVAAFAKTPTGPWWILGGLAAAYIVTRRGRGDAGPPGTVS